MREACLSSSLNGAFKLGSIELTTKGAEVGPLFSVHHAANQIAPTALTDEGSVLPVWKNELNGLSVLQRSVF